MKRQVRVTLRLLKITITLNIYGVHFIKNEKKFEMGERGKVTFSPLKSEQNLDYINFHFSHLNEKY